MQQNAKLYTVLNQLFAEKQWRQQLQMQKYITLNDNKRF